MIFKNYFNQHREDPRIAARIQAATKVTMDKESREKMRAMLSQYAQMRPIRSEEGADAEFTITRLSIFLTRHSMPAFALVLVLLVGGGTAAAAQGALPGDLLYPVKVHVNEELQATLAITAKAKAAWAVDRAERRLEEAATLAVAGKLNDVTRAELDTNFSTHLKTAREDGAQLERDNDIASAAEVETHIGATLRAHEEVLSSVRAKLSEMKKEQAQVDAVISSVHAAAFTSAEKEITLESKIKQEPESSVATAALDKRTSARRSIETTKELLVRSKKRLNSDAKSKAQVQLKVATDAFVAGEASDARGDKGSAFSDFNAALRGALQTGAFVSGRLNVSATSDDEDHRATTATSSANTVNIAAPKSSSTKADLGL